MASHEIEVAWFGEIMQNGQSDDSDSSMSDFESLSFEKLPEVYEEYYEMLDKSDTQCIANETPKYVKIKFWRDSKLKLAEGFSETVPIHTPEMLDSSSDVEELPPKKRGRPKKATLNENGTEPLIATASDTSEMLNSPSDVVKISSKKRGRPKKATVNENSTEPLIATTSITSEMLNSPSDIVQISSKKRGRPKKASVTFDAIQNETIFDEQNTQGQNSIFVKKLVSIFFKLQIKL